VSIAEKVAQGDTALFEYVEGQTSEEDRRALLAIHDALAERLGTFAYLEIGSHLGGSLQAFLADPRCRRIVSIDPRPLSQPDDRGGTFAYDENSTARMLSLLDAVPGADLEKLHTIERSTEDIEPGSLARPDLCLIDGEHTYVAALRDARFCRAAMNGTGVVLFHDRWVVEPAIVAFVRETRGPLTAYPMRGGLFVIELGAEVPLLGRSGVAKHVAPGALVWRLASRLGIGRTMVSAIPHARRLRRIAAR
jgi:Methyltransferase domain